jgi:hypothetical protein
MKRPAGDTARAATSDELNDLSRKSRSTRAEPLVCVGWPTQAARKKPASESGGLKWAQSFLTKGLAAERSQRHRQDDMGSGIGGATDEMPSRAIGLCVGRPTPGHENETGLSSTIGLTELRRPAHPPTR